MRRTEGGGGGRLQHHWAVQDAWTVFVCAGGLFFCVCECMCVHMWLDVHMQKCIINWQQQPPSLPPLMHPPVPEHTPPPTPPNGNIVSVEVLLQYVYLHVRVCVYCTIYYSLEECYHTQRHHFNLHWEPFVLAEARPLFNDATETIELGNRADRTNLI